MIEPAAEPRPGPTAMPLSLEKRTKSQTIRKYDSKPISAITPSSKSARSRASAGTGSP